MTAACHLLLLVALMLALHAVGLLLVSNACCASRARIIIHVCLHLASEGRVDRTKTDR
jgi:hypothetical protein